jgi:polyhydroxyalkanoate synthesis regulator phasin
MSASRVDKKDSKETILQEFVRYSLRAARGLGNVAEEEGKELVKKMVEVEKITPEEGDKLLNTLLTRMQTSKNVFERRVEESVTKATEKLSSISSRELDGTKERIANIDQRIGNLVTKKNPRIEL